MDSTQTDAQVEFDTKVLSRFIYEMNITRRYVLSYPPEHPVIASSIWKVLQSLELLLQNQHSITIGVARNALMVSQGMLDRKNPVYRDLAAFFFSRNIATITFDRDLSDVEFASFVGIVNSTPEAIRAAGGIVRMLDDADIRSVTATEVDYGSFLVTEEATVTTPTQAVVEHQGTALWGKFVQGLLDGNLDPTGGKLVNIDDIDPEKLAEFLNDRAELLAGDGAGSYARAITQFMRQLDSDEIASQVDEVTTGKLGEFVKCLSPSLRRQFLQSSFDAMQEPAELLGKVVSDVPDDVIMESIGDVSMRGAHLSQGVMNLLQFISKASGATTPGRRSVDAAPVSDEELGERLKSIFREDEPDRFIPEEYQATLKSIAAADTIPVLSSEETEAIRRELMEYQVETHVSDVILEIMDQEMEQDQGEILKETLQEFCELFLETGDFRSLAKIHLRLSRQCSGPSFGLLPIHEGVMAFYLRPEAIEAVLDGLTVWGKAKYEEILLLINSVGAPFVEPLFQRLAEEKSLSLRRYYMERLQELGAPAREYALRHLRDRRWYVVRNCIVLLRNLGDPSVLGQLRVVADHPHVRVRQELLRTLMRFEHPAAGRLIAREIGAADVEMQRFAVQLAGKTRDPLVFERLGALLAVKALGESDYDLKIAAVRSLAKMGNPSILPSYERILNARTLLRSARLQLLKEEIVRSLEHYPYDAVMPVLDRVARSGNAELATVAASVRQAVEARRYAL